MALTMLAPLSTADHAAATRLILCDEAGNAGQQSYLMPDGRRQLLQVADAANDNCISKRIATASTMIGWRSLVSEEVANSSKAGISLLGEKAENHYNVSEVIPVDAPGSSQRSRIPTTGIGANLLPTLSLQWSIWPVFAGIAPHEYVTNAFGTGTTTPPTSD